LFSGLSKMAIGLAGKLGGGRIGEGKKCLRVAKTTQKLLKGGQ
jgi:hypothetical protein